MDPVLADIVEASQNSILAADDDDILSGDAAGDVAARLPQLAEMARIAPGAGEDRLLLPGIDPGIDIVPGRKGMGALRIGIESSDRGQILGRQGQIAKLSQEDLEIAGDDYPDRELRPVEGRISAPHA